MLITSGGKGLRISAQKMNVVKKVPESQIKGMDLQDGEQIIRCFGLSTDLTAIALKSNGDAAFLQHEIQAHGRGAQGIDLTSGAPVVSVLVKEECAQKLLLIDSRVYAIVRKAAAPEEFIRTGKGKAV